MLHKLLRNWMPRTRRPHPIRRSSRSWSLLRLEDRTVPSNGTIGYAIGAGNGNAPNQVEVFDTTGALIVAFNAFPNLIGVHVATGDINGDGVPDIVVGAGFGGPPEVKVYDGAAIAQGGSAAQTAIENPLEDFHVYPKDPTFNGGVNVAVGNINGQSSDGTATGTPVEDIVTGAGPGGAPQVNVFSANGTNLFPAFEAYDATYFRGGVSVAAGNVGGDTGNPPIHPISSDEIVTGAGIGGRAHVEVYSVSLTSDTALDRVSSYYAYNANFFGGVNVSVGNITNNVDTSGNKYADIITGAGPTNQPDFIQNGGPSPGPRVIVWRLDNGDNEATDPTTDSDFSFVEAANFEAYTMALTGGVTVGVTNSITSDGQPDFITGVGQGGGPHLIIWSGNNFVTSFGTPANPNGDLATYTPTKVQQQYVYDPTYTAGFSVSE